MSNMQLVALVDAPRVVGVPYRRLWSAVVNGLIPSAERRGGQWFLSVEDARAFGKRDGLREPVTAAPGGAA
jgi:hypothetical protein